MCCIQHTTVKKLLLSAQLNTYRNLRKNLRLHSKFEHIICSLTSKTLGLSSNALQFKLPSSFCDNTKSKNIETRLKREYTSYRACSKPSKRFMNCWTHVSNMHHRFPNALLCRRYSGLLTSSKSTATFTFSKTSAFLWQYNTARKCSCNVVQSPACVHSGRVDVEDQPPSWLFVSPAVAGAYGAQVNVELSLDERLDGEALEALRENVKARGLSVDIDGLLQNLKALKQMQKEKAALFSQKDQLLHQFKLLKATAPNENTEPTEKELAEKLRAVKTAIASLKPSWDLEEKVMVEALRLPNDFHPSTPLDKPEVLREQKLEAETAESAVSHVEIARKFDLIKFSNVGPKAYYLKRELVLAEAALSSAVCDFLRTSGYRHISGPEFVKTPIIEGCGGDVREGSQVFTMVDPHKTVIEPMNHLTGVSPHMFAAYVAKTCIGDSALPLRMFACGRNYQNSDLPGLFGAIQSTQADVFACVKEGDLDQQFENTVELVWDFLKQFGFTVRLSRVSAQNLRREQRRRLDVEMFSPNLQTFLPVGSVSDMGDFVSRRLMVTHNQNHADIRTAKRLHMIHGTVLNITSFLALWMEHSDVDKEKFTLCHLPPLQVQS